MTTDALDFDYVVIGSGFGGSVAALRLSEKGYRVCVIEKGRRFRGEDFPETNWDLRRYLWLPRLGLRGPQALTLLRHVLLLHGVGLGIFGYRNLYVCDGSVIPANPGTAPSLTIAAMAERCMSKIPVRAPRSR